MINLIFTYRVHCYDEKNAFLDIEWTVSPKGRWAGSPDVFQGKYTDCLYMDWGAVEFENSVVDVYCFAKNHPEAGGLSRVVGTVKNDGELQFY